MKTSSDINTRKIKVCEVCAVRKHRKLCFVPQIRLCGKWLLEAGFRAGDDIKIVTMNKCLLIVPAEKKSLEL